jgi:hypothetical protein
VFAIAWTWFLGPKSALVLGIPGNWPLAIAAGASAKVAPKSGLVAAAIANIPTGIHAELHDILEASDLLSSCRLAARQSAAPIEIHRLLALRDQVSVQESSVALFIEIVAGDVLRTVTVQLLQSKLVGILSSPRNSSQLRILLPKIGFNQFSGSQEFQNCNVTLAQLGARTGCCRCDPGRSAKDQHEKKPTSTPRTEKDNSFPQLLQVGQERHGMRVLWQHQGSGVSHGKHRTSGRRRTYVRPCPRLLS